MTRLSVSNIAWERADEDDAVKLLTSCGIELVDIAPGKYFPDPFTASLAEIHAVRDWWRERGFGIEGMQSLLFGTQGLNLFDDDDGVMFARLEAVCRIAAGLGARVLTFGSPRQRDRSGLSDQEAADCAIDFFGRLGERAHDYGVIMCLEPNPAIYNCNFMVTTEAAAAIVEAVASPAIRLQLDTGAITANAEDPESTIANFAHLIGHVHASEPGLVPLGDGSGDHARLAAALAAAVPERVIAIEMATTPLEPPLAAVARAIAVAQNHYDPPMMGGAR